MGQQRSTLIVLMVAPIIYHSPRYLIPNGTGQCDRSQTGQCDRPRLAQWDLALRNRPIIELTK